MSVWPWMLSRKRSSTCWVTLILESLCQRSHMLCEQSRMMSRRFFSACCWARAGEQQAPIANNVNTMSSLCVFIVGDYGCKDTKNRPYRKNNVVSCKINKCVCGGRKLHLTCVEAVACWCRFALRCPVVLVSGLFFGAIAVLNSRVAEHSLLCTFFYITNPVGVWCVFPAPAG